MRIVFGLLAFGPLCINHVITNHNGMPCKPGNNKFIQSLLFVGVGAKIVKPVCPEF